MTRTQEGVPICARVGPLYHVIRRMRDSLFTVAVSDALKQMARAPRYAEYFVHFVLVDSLD